MSEASPRRQCDDRVYERGTAGHDTNLMAISSLGMLMHAKGDPAAAEALLRETLEVKRETLGSRHPSTLATINNLGTLLKAKGDLAAAEPLFREVLDGQRATDGIGHPDTLDDTLKSIHNLGLQLAAAEPLLCEVLEGQRDTEGDRHPDTLHDTLKSVDNGSFGLPLMKVKAHDLAATASSS